AGTNSGVGKTTITTGLIAALRKRGLRVQPFKCGPDYIDPTYHSLAAGLPCRNLDSWMLSKDSMVELFTHAAARADIAVVEGVMGLYDGRNGLESAGSTAEIAVWLDAPVILIIDVAKMSGSAAAIALGYRRLDPEVNLAGVILNNVGSPSHLRWATEAVEERAGISVVGHLPKNAEIKLPERHLGLVPTVERGELSDFIEKLREQIELTVDVAAILRLAEQAGPVSQPLESKLFPKEPIPKRVKIAVARDEAFSFYYEDNLDLLTAWGAEIVFISPLHDRGLPPDIAGIYIGGGFPEVYAADLATNAEFKQSLVKAAEAGMPIYAECGGLMYLSEGIIDFYGNRHAMVGLVPGWARMQKKLARMGYAVAEVLQDSILSQKGTNLRGHVFHWSKMPEPTDRAAYRLLEPSEQTEGFVIGPESNVLASYLHLHFGSELSLAKRFIEVCGWWGNQLRRICP
ncbi:MAG: cobyrinate a,c-diamide synthase, partial [Chloroflexota bacterium]|nr:cobyrinate a,c-diamide synthase [Chloroflexota bacterium]